MEVRLPRRKFDTKGYPLVDVTSRAGVVVTARVVTINNRPVLDVPGLGTMSAAWFYRRGMGVVWGSKLTLRRLEREGFRVTKSHRRAAETG